MPAPSRWAALAALCAVAVVVVICVTVSSRSELLLDGMMPVQSSTFDIQRPSGFDYYRPDFEDSLNTGYLGGQIGYMPGATFWKQPTQSSLPMAPAPGAVRVVAVAQDRGAMSNVERADASRCHGVLHACLNWMKVHEGDMRLVVDKQSSWCTSSVDGGVHSCSVAHPDMDTVVSIPASGGDFPVELWGFLQQSCPMLNTCTMPPALAYNEADAVFAARLPSILALAREEHAQCCLERQQARALRYGGLRAGGAGGWGGARVVGYVRAE